MAKTRFYVLPKAVVALALMLSACSGGGGDSRAELRKLAGVSVPAKQPAEATSLPSPTQIVLTPESTEQPVIVEVTRQVVDVQQIEVTRVIEIVTTPTPDIQGFQDSGVDESIQPCPKPFWKRGRCVATDAQIEAYAQGTVQP